MEDLTIDNFSKSTVSTDSECNLSPDNIVDDQEKTENIDNRIACTNSRSLNMIMQIVSSHVAEFSKSLNLGEEQSREFSSRFLEVFKDNIQDNVTVNGLPYAMDKNLLSPFEKDNLTNETKEALLSDLSKKVEAVCAKRKRIPRESNRVYKMRLHHEYQNFKKGPVNHKVNLPSVTKGSFKLDSLLSQNLEETTDQLKSSQIKLTDSMEELKSIQNNIEYAKNIISQEESMCDTGYISSCEILIEKNHPFVL